MDFSVALRDTLARRLCDFVVEEGGAAAAGLAERPVRASAAVALTIVEEGLGADLDGIPAPEGWSSRAAIILTRRAAGLRRHAGQWAIPGGRIDAGESPSCAALRELSEEVNLTLTPDAILGRLDDITTHSGFAITPWVVWGDRGQALVPEPDEVASIHRVPLTELLREDAPILEWEAGQPTPVLRMPIGTGTIAAPTAAILYQFREVCLRGRNTRVAHFSHPRFAWR